jgi:hypothetical protein
MAGVQRTQSILKRLIIDNQQMRNTTRYEASVGAIKNPRDLLDNTIGGVIWSRQPGSVTPLATPELSPLTMNVVQMLKQDGEERNGMSGLAKGMEMGAVNNQNASDMIAKLTSAGQRRVLMAARDFARTFLVPLSQHIIKLAIQNDKSQDKMEIAGQVIPVVPSSWNQDDLDMEVEAALTPDEAVRSASQLMMVHQLLMQDQTMAGIYGVTQRHALFDKVLDDMGMKNTAHLLMSPTSQEFQQMMMQQQVQMEEQQQEQRIMSELQKTLMASQAASYEAQAESMMMSVQTTLTDKMFDNQMDSQEHAHKQYVDLEKLAIERAKLEKMGNG